MPAAEKNTSPKANRQRSPDELTKFLGLQSWREDFFLIPIHKKNTSKFKWMCFGWSSLGCRRVRRERCAKRDVCPE
jgi:hypothetical protein